MRIALYFALNFNCENFAAETTYRTQQYIGNKGHLGQCEFCYSVLSLMIKAISSEFLYKLSELILRLLLSVRVEIILNDRNENLHRT